jgi:hypothetical protein
MTDPSETSTDDLVPWQPVLPSRMTRTPASRSRFSATGSWVYDDRTIFTESDTERIVGYALAMREDVLDLREQPPFVTYMRDGVQYRHWFDYLMLRVPAIRTAVAVKWSTRRKKSGIDATVKLIAEQNPPTFADEIVVLTEKDFTRDERYNAELVHESRSVPNRGHDAHMRETAGHIDGIVTIDDLVAKSELGGDGFRAVARLVGHRFLRLARGTRIDYGAHVQRRL